MVTKHISTVKEQIAYFDSRLKKAPTDSFTQATYWPLKYKFEQLLNFLLNQYQSKELDTVESPNLVVKNCDRLTKDKTIEMENNIIDFLRVNQNGRHVKDIHAELSKKDPNISYAKVANKISEMYSKKQTLEWVGKGIYKVKE